MSGRETNKRQTERTVRHDDCQAEVQAILYQASILARQSQHSRSSELAFLIDQDRIFERLDLSLQVFRPKCTRIRTFLPERLSPFALLAPNKSIWPSFQSIVTLALPALATLPFDNWNLLPEQRPAPQCEPAVNPVGPPPAGPAAATADIGDSANWGECPLRLERVAV